MRELGNVRYTPIAEDYFMSDQDNANLIGGLMLDYRKISEQVTSFRARASQIGDLYEKIGAGLKQHPETVCSQGVGIDTRFSSERVSVDPSSVIPIAEILSITENLRTALLKQKELAASLKSFNIPEY
jgi:hypothetical protein